MLSIPILCLLIFTAVPSEQAPLQTTISGIRESETLYSDFDIKLMSSYRTGPNTPTMIGDNPAILTKSEGIHFITQDGRFRFEIDGQRETVNGSSISKGISCFNGLTTKMLHGDVGNIHKSKKEDTRFVRPHMMLLRDMSYGVPLSIYLSGPDAIRSHPLNHLGADTIMSVAYEGEANLQDQHCDVVSVTLGTEQQPRYCSEKFWISTERNYLPIRIEHFSPPVSATTPSGYSSATNMMEVSPGIWLPSEIEITAFQKPVLQETGKQIPSWERTYKVESASLNPKYSSATFETVDFPAGTAVYEVDSNGEVTNSWRVDAPGSPDAPKLYTRWWLVWINLAAVIFVAILLTVRRGIKTGGI